MLKSPRQHQLPNWLKNWNKCRSHRFWWCPLWSSRLYCYHSGLYNVTKTLTFASYFVKCKYKFRIDSQLASWYFRKIFIPSPIFFFNLNLILVIRSFKSCDWLRHKSFKSHTFDACKWPRFSKKTKHSHKMFCLK